MLAQQHYRSITAMLGDLATGGMLGGADDATRVELLTGSMTKGQRTEPLSRIASGESGLLIGTHALLEDTVMFADLGLVVVDEQHRFGVEQRAALTDKAGSPPHVLVMTATPIPRTVAMTVFGDLEVSTLAELPAGRAAIQTNVVNLLDHPGWMRGSGSGCARRSTRATRSTSSAPASPATQEQGEIDHRDDEDGDGGARDPPRWPRTGSPPSTTCSPSSPRARWPACGSRRCTAGCRRRRRTPRCGPSPPARSTCWSRPP